MVTLLLTEKGGETKQLNFEKDEVTVGRVQGNDIVLPKGNVSKRHCRVMLQSGKFSVEDLKSTNGTYINGRKIGEVTPVVGTDKIYVGDFVDPGRDPRRSHRDPSGGRQRPRGGLADHGVAAPATAAPARPDAPPPPWPPSDSLDEPEAKPEARDAQTRVAAPPPPRRQRPAGFGPGPQHDAARAGPAPELPPLGDADDEVAVAPAASAGPAAQVAATLAFGQPRRGRTNAGRRRADLAPRSSAGRSTAPAWTPGPTTPRRAWLRDLLAKEGATAVYVSGNRVEVERHGHRETVTPPAGARPGRGGARHWRRAGRPRPSGDTRVINVFLPENARLAAIFPPVAGELCATIERTAPASRTLSELTASGASPRTPRRCSRPASRVGGTSSSAATVARSKRCCRPWPTRSRRTCAWWPWPTSAPRPARRLDQTFARHPRAAIWCVPPPPCGPTTWWST